MHASPPPCLHATIYSLLLLRFFFIIPPRAPCCPPCAGGVGTQEAQRRHRVPPVHADPRPRPAGPAVRAVPRLHVRQPSHAGGAGDPVGTRHITAHHSRTQHSTGVTPQFSIALQSTAQHGTALPGTQGVLTGQRAARHAGRSLASVSMLPWDATIMPPACSCTRSQGCCHFAARGRCLR